MNVNSEIKKNNKQSNNFDFPINNITSTTTRSQIVSLTLRFAFISLISIILISINHHNDTSQLQLIGHVQHRQLEHSPSI